MGLVVSLILITVGAILTWAVNSTSSSIDVNTVGVILMVVGFIGFVLSLLFWSTWGGPAFFRGGYYAEGDPVVRRRYYRPGARRRTTYVEDDVPPPGPPPP